MQIKVTYNKSTGVISLEKDVKLIEIELNQNAIEDTADSLYFEIAVDTTAYEVDNSYNPEESIEEIFE